MLLISCKSNQVAKEPATGPLPSSDIFAPQKETPITPSDEPSGGSSSGLYGQLISIPQDASPKVVSLANELADYLKKGTGKTFRVSQSGQDKGITLMLDIPPGTSGATATNINSVSLESFYLKSNGNSVLYISARTEPGLSHGVFQYLEKLGYRWYFPGDKWTIVPSLTSIGIQADEVVSPAFQNRSFFGTGGYGANKVLDPENNSMKAWNTWMSHNSWGLEYEMPGHRGAVFNLKQKEILIAHPEYQPEINGKRVAWNANNKHCYSNDGLTALWAKDRIEEYESLLKRFPDNYPRISIGVDPSDGGGHCQCRACLKMGSVSNRVFHAANVVAKTASRKYPDTKVCLYAYNAHAAVPDIPIHKNVAVSIIPYKFQMVAPPEVFVEDWSKKVSNMNLYDYWNYTDIGFDKPQLNFLTLQDKIKFWAEKKIAGITLETSYSIGANGLGLYLGSKLMWNPDLSVDSVLDEFYRLTFGKAAAPMRRMMERWASQYHHLQQYELGNAFADIAQAEKLEKDPAIVARINDFKAYLHYLVLLHEFLALPKAAPDRVAKADQLVQYIWQINPTYMIHSYRISDRFVKIPAASTPSIRKKYETNPKVSNPDAWQRIHPLTTSETERNFNAKKSAYSLTIPVVNYKGKLTLPTRPQSQGQPQTRALPGPDDYSKFTMLSGNTFMIYNEFPNQSLTFEMKAITPTATNLPKVRNFISFQSPSGNIASRVTIPLDSKWHSYTYSMNETGVYTMVCDINALGVEFKYPTHIPSAFHSQRPKFYKPPAKLYFYVPKDLEKVYFEIEKPFVKIEIESPNGTKKTISGVRQKLQVLEIPENERGKLWSYYSSWMNFKILNVPPYHFLSKNYFLPEDLAK